LHGKLEYRALSATLSQLSGVTIQRNARNVHNATNVTQRTQLTERTQPPLLSLRQLRVAYFSCVRYARRVRCVRFIEWKLDFTLSGGSSLAMGGRCYSTPRFRLSTPRLELSQTPSWWEKAPTSLLAFCLHWNSLPSHLKEADLLYSQFQRWLKTFLFG